MSDENNIDIENLKELTKDTLANLTVEEAKVLRERFGIEISADSILEEVTKQFDITRERIEKIEKRALEKLKKKQELESLPKCFFCKLGSDQVKRLIAAPDADVFICDGCVKECLRILDVPDE